VERVEMKNRFAFVYMPSQREADSAIRGLNRAFGGESATRLRVEFTRGDGEVKKREEKRREMAKRQPNTTLFVVNFDPDRTRPRDLEDAFGPYGALARADIKRNFAFVEFRRVEDAIKAKEALNGVMLGDGLGEIVVEYQARVSNVDRSDRDRDRDRDRSPPRRRSRSPVGRRSRSPAGRRDDRDYRRDDRRDDRDYRRRSRSRS
jgi:splicing factor, arginine/serine-rich 4/5/6